MDEFMLNCVITCTLWNISILMHHFTARVITHFQVIFQFNSSPFKFDAIKSRSLHNTTSIVVCDSGLAVKPFFVTVCLWCKIYNNLLYFTTSFR